MTVRTVTAVLGANVATSGTFDVSYPTGFNAGHFKVGRRHRLVANQRSMEAPKDFTISFGASAATITYLGATTIPAGSTVFVELDAGGFSEPDETSIEANLTSKLGTPRVVLNPMVLVEFGAPVALSTTALRAAAAIGGAGAVTLIAAATTFDVPRNVTTTSSGNDSGTTYTVTGEDDYGNTVVENIAGGNIATSQGNKAFKKITSIVASGAGTGNISFGFGDKLGFPVHVPGAGNIVREILDGAAATAGTLAAGSTSTQTATTGDVRGTYIPNSATNGSRTYEVLLALAEPTYRGGPQFAG